MYLTTQTDQLRQGDVLTGTAFIGRGVEVTRVKQIADTMSTGGDVSWNEKVLSHPFVILSQCCDLASDANLLVASVLPFSSVQLNRIEPEQLEAFKLNALGVTSNEAQGTITGLDHDGELLEKVRLVLPGYFYLETLEGVFDEEKIVHFSLIRSIRRKEILELNKVAELTPQSRASLRRRLAVFFGRVPDEDIALLDE